MKILPKYRIVASILTSFVIVEFVLRIILGLGNPPLSQKDPDTGYRFKPNQNVKRFGKRIKYNQYSQRSEPITLEKPKGVTRILMTGDSVLNGGIPTDQSKTISELLKARLSSSGKSVEVLNASAGSWAIGNELGYLRKFGTFQSDVVVLEIGSNDFTQPMNTGEMVGHDWHFPDRPPLLATQELIIRYILLQFLAASNSNSPAPQILESEVDQQFQQNMQQLKAMVSLVRAKQIPVFVLFTPDRADLIPKFSTPKYKSEFLKILRDLQVPVFDIHLAWSTLPTTTVESYFRDGVHFTEAGNQAVADLTSKEVCAYSKLEVCSQNSSN